LAGAGVSTGAARGARCAGVTSGSVAAAGGSGVAAAGDSGAAAAGGSGGTQAGIWANAGRAKPSHNAGPASREMRDIAITADRR
jgi:hypothetical protein